jgi:hypothetical protein
LPIVWATSSAAFARRHRRDLAFAMLVLSIFATAGMMLGWGYWGNWMVLGWDNNAAGWGLILIPAGVVALLIARRRHAGEAGRHCPACDYDLTGNVSGVCPECGRALAAG